MQLSYACVGDPFPTSILLLFFLLLLPRHPRRPRRRPPSSLLSRMIFIYLPPSETTFQPAPNEPSLRNQNFLRSNDP